MSVMFETERLIVREWDPEQDAEDAFEMYSDPKVVRFLGRQPTVETSLEDQREKIRKRVAFFRERNDGTGMWAIETSDGKRVVGTLLLKNLPDGDGVLTEDVEIGWHLKRSEWGKGYATEAAQEGVRYAFDRLGLEVLYAVIYAENTKSIAITRRLGMTPKGPTDKYYGVTVELFELRRT